MNIRGKMGKGAERKGRKKREEKRKYQTDCGKRT